MSSADSQLASQFRSLFDGRTDAYGLRHGQVMRTLVNDGVYLRHLAGAQPMGVFPLLDNGDVRFCAIDLDRDDRETAWNLSSMLPGPSWVERTRSGHYHVWSFFDEPLRGWVARFIMRAVLEALGQENVEVFPKTDTLRPGMLGNYINLPYPGAAPLQYMERPMGRPYDLLSFLSAADNDRASAGSWRARATTLGAEAPEHRESAVEFGDQDHLHDCALYILEGARSGERPLAEGHRSKVLFALAKQLLNWRLSNLDAARNVLLEVNATADRPLPEHEVERIMGTVLRGQYTSTGCDDPVVRPYCRPDCPIASGS